MNKISIEKLLNKNFANIKNLDQQKKNLFFLFFGLIIVFVLYNIFFSTAEQDRKKKIKKQDGKKIEIKKVAVEAEDKWMIEASGKLNNLTKQLEDEKKEREDLMEKFDARFEDIQNSIIALNDAIVQKNDLAQESLKKDNFDIFSGNQNLYNDNLQLQSRNIATHTVNLKSGKSDNHFYKKSKNYVSQGSYASGILISAVDAAVGISSREDPRPVLIRLTGDAISASFKGNKEKTDLRGCVITAGAEGDLSSERVYIKLSRMTCARKKGEIFEIAIKGYVSGLGKAGIRGIVVSRDWDKLSKAFASGLISGFGSSFSKSLQPPAALTSTGTVFTEQQSVGNALKAGMGDGIKKSGDTLSDYYIKRAEQYQPVISIPSGVDIEVVFLEGFSMEAPLAKK